jgi:hypothetical protein
MESVREYIVYGVVGCEAVYPGRQALIYGTTVFCDLTLCNLADRLLSTRLHDTTVQKVQKTIILIFTAVRISSFI